MKFHHIILAILVTAIWGFNFVLVKVGLNEIPPFLYGAGRFIIAASPILFFLKKPATSWGIITGIGLCLGFMKFALMFMGIYVGMPAGLASLVLQSQVFFTIGLSMLFLGSRITFFQVLGMVLAFCGIGTIAWQMHAQSSIIGFLFILSAAFFWGVSNILYRKAGNVDMFSLTVWTSLIPPLPMLGCSLFFEGTDAVGAVCTQITWVGIASLVFAACISTWIGTTLWGTLLKNYDASIVAPFSLLVPVFGLSSTWLFLGEEFSLITFGACSLVFIGLIINQCPAALSRLFGLSHLEKAPEEASVHMDKAA